MLEYSFSNHRLILTDEDGNSEDFCEEARVVKVITHLPLNKVSVEVLLWSPQMGKNRIECSHAEITSNPISVLAQYGLSLANTKQNASILANVLLDTKRRAEQTYRHDILGFGTLAKQRVFFGAKLVGSQVNSRHINKVALSSAGTFAEWRQGVSQYAQDHPPLQLALALGACSPVAALLLEQDLLKAIPLVALIGESSTGKTSALKLMASIWGKPAIGTGVIDTLLDTPNRFFANLGQKHGFPAFIDETSCLTNWDFTREIYNLSLGKERGRCNPDGSPRPENTWRNAIIFTGETSMLAQSNQNGGLMARLLELTLPWTKDQESSDNMTNFLAGCYGTAYVPLIEHLLAMDPQEIVKQFQEAQEQIRDRFSSISSVDRRLTNLFALVLMTAKIIKLAWDIPIDEDGILALLPQHSPTTMLQEQANRFHSLLMEKVLANTIHFPEKGALRGAQSIWGYKDEYHGRSCIWICADQFNTIGRGFGEDNFHAIKRQLVKDGLLAKFHDRYAIRRELLGLPVTCYCVYPSSTPCTTTTSPKPPRVSRPKPLRLLVEEDEEMEPPQATEQDGDCA